MPVWVRLVVVVAMLKCVAAIGVAVFGGDSSQISLPFRPYQYAL
jgi:hypothetical protein